MGGINKDLLKCFISTLCSFPVSLDRSTVFYQYSKLQGIKQKRELESLSLTNEEIKSAIKLATDFGDIANIIRENNIADAIKIYERYKSDHLSKMSGYLYFYVQQWGLSVEALYFYKKKNYALAIDLTIQCIKICDALITRGLTSLVLRCVQQNINLAQIYIATKQLSKGFGLYGDILNYLLNGKYTKSITGESLKMKKFWETNISIIEPYSYDYFVTLVNKLMRYNLSEPLNKNSFYCQFDNFEFIAISNERQIMQQWIEIKRMLYEEKHNQFILSLFDFFSFQLPKSFDILKISFLYDIKCIIVKDKIYSRDFSETIKEYLSLNQFSTNCDFLLL